MSLVPVTLLAGFLGSGKTTLVNRILRSSDLSGTGVIVNEFGSIGIDDVLIEGSAADVVLLRDGCACCTMRGDLAKSMLEFVSRCDEQALHLKRIVIETSGVCDPVPILHELMLSPSLAKRFRVDGTITVVDAFAKGLFERHEEAAIQVAVADRICLSKSDIANQQDAAEVLAALREINPRAPIHDLNDLAFEVASLFGNSLSVRLSAEGGVLDWLGEVRSAGPHPRRSAHGSRDAAFRAFTLLPEQPISWDGVAAWMDSVSNAYGAEMLRVKGILATTEWPEQPVVVHGVRHIFHPPVRLSRWPSDDRRSRLVFITIGLTPNAVERSLAALYAA